MPLASPSTPPSLQRQAQVRMSAKGVRVWHSIATGLLALTALFWLLVLGIAALLQVWVIPHIDSLRPHVESWASQKMEAKITIGSLSTAHAGWLPRFEAKDVRIENTATRQGVHLERVEISVSPLRLLSGALDQLVIEAPELDASRDASGHVHIAGFAINLDTTNTTPSSGFNWLMSQREIIIDRGTLHWQDDALQQAKVTFTDVSFILKNGVRSHQAKLLAKPPPAWGQHIQLAAKLSQPLLESRAGQWQSWSGQIYTELQAPQPERVLNAIFKSPAPAWLSAAKQLDGTARLQAWADIAAPMQLGRTTITAHQIPALATYLQAQYDPARPSVHLEGTHIQIASLLAGAKPWLDQTSTRTADLVALTKNGFIERLQLDAKVEAKALSNIKLEASFTSPDATGDVQGVWQKTQEPLGQIDLTARLSRLDLTAVHRYLPATTSAATRQSVQGALQAGTANGVKMHFKGAASAFPLGWLRQPTATDTDTAIDTTVFRLSGFLNNAQLALAPHWPSLSKTNAKFTVSETALAITQIDTLWGGIATQASVQIADLRQPVAEITAEATKTTLASVLDLINQTPFNGSPTQDSKGVFSQAKATGLVDLKAKLKLPLAHWRNSTFHGQVQLLDNTLVFNAQTPPLTHLKGQIVLSEAGLELQNLRAQLLGGEVSLSGPHQHIKGQGSASVEALKAWQPSLKAGLSKATGSAAYSIDIQPLAKDGNNVRIESNLVGLALDFPAPLAKAASTPWPTRYQQGFQGQFALAIRDGLAAPSTENTDSAIFDAQLVQQGTAWFGQIAVGRKASAPDTTQPGIGLTIQLPTLDISAWQTALRQPATAATIAPSTSPSTAPATPLTTVTSNFNFELPNRVSAQIQDVIWNDRHFEHVVLGASRFGRTWRMNAQASDFSGYAEYRTPATAGAQPQLYARLARLSIPDANSKNRIEQLLEIPQTSLPGLDIVIDDFDFLGKKLGRLEVVATNQRSVSQLAGAQSGQPQSEWRLQKLGLVNPDATLSATGVWSKPKPEAPSRVDLQFNWVVQNSGDLLTRFGLPGTLKDGKGQLQGRIGWVGSPLGLHYPSLTGLIKLEMTQGQFLKIDPGVGRLLSVLSLQALPRRLTLDFRDVFSEGFAFDAINGDAQIKEGVIETTNLQMKSVLALVTLQGSADLAKETQNLRVLVLPDINAGGASLLAAIINPVMGVITYLTQWVLKRPAVVAATKAYKIEGSWREPVVTSIAP